MTPHLELAVRRAVVGYESRGPRLGAARKAYDAARIEWPQLDPAMFDEIFETWAAYHVNGECAEEDRGERGFEPLALTEYIEAVLEGELRGHVDFKWRGTTFQVKARTGAGQRALAAVFADGRRLASDFRTAVWQLWSGFTPTDADLNAAVVNVFGFDKKEMA